MLIPAIRVVCSSHPAPDQEHRTGEAVCSCRLEFHDGQFPHRPPFTACLARAAKSLRWSLAVLILLRQLQTIASCNSAWH